jgi:hypothetical protein
MSTEGYKRFTPKNIRKSALKPPVKRLIQHQTVFTSAEVIRLQ